MTLMISGSIIGYNDGKINIREETLYRIQGSI